TRHEPQKSILFLWRISKVPRQVANSDCRSMMSCFSNYHTGTLVEHGYDTLQKDKDLLDAKASASAFLFCFVSLNALVSYYFISILRADLM
ncbi:TPA: hypothetical protein ACGO18_001787, partial [Streptococcus suis]